MRTVVGTGVPGFAGDGQRAAAAQLNDPRGLALGTDGSLYIADQLNNRIRRVTPDGFIQTVVGGGEAELSDGRLPTKIKLDKPDGISVGSDGALFIATGTTVYKVAPGLTELAKTNDSLIPAEDGRTLYRFDSRGKHLETINAVTGVTELRFDYEKDSGLLTAITDKNNLVTKIVRDDEGVPGTIIGPFGQRTNLDIFEGDLKSITDPLDRTVSLEYADGLLSKVVSPEGAERVFKYDDDGLGLLRKVTDPSGYFEEYEPAALPPGVEPGIGNVALTVRTPGGTETKYTTTQSGEVINRIIQAAGVDEASSTDAITSVPLRLVDGTRMVKTFNADTGLGSQVLIPADETITTPGGRTLQTFFQETKRFEDPENLLSATQWQNVVILNDKAFETSYDRTDRTVRTRSPLGRIRTTVLDEDGRATDTEAPGFGGTHFDYDKFGRVIAATRTAGNETRTQTYAYDDSDGFMRSVTDALDQTTSYEPDLVGRLQALIDPSGARFEQTLDGDNRLKLLTLPGSKPHAFEYDDETNRLLRLVTPPAVDSASSTNLPIGNVSYSYNNEDLPTLIERSDGNNLEIAYDDAKRVKTLTTSGIALNYSYDRTGRPTRIARSDGPTLDTEFDGALLTRMEWTGPIEGKVTAEYDADFRLSQLTVNDASTASYAYDDDGAIISATANQQTLTVDYDRETGLTLGTNLGNVSTSLSHNAFGELNGLSATFQDKIAFTQNLERDTLGRIVQLDETLGNIETTTLYTYDAAGRLETVTRGDDVTAYQYDENGNRLAIQLNGEETVTAEYDAQDRLVSHGALTFEQTEHGDLLRRTGPDGALELAYDGVGNLLTATASTATASKVIDYTIDGLGRRVGKQVGGKFSRAWLYRDHLRPVAEITDGGVFTHFIYASNAPGAPDFMLRAGVPFRIIKDHLGSVRVVVNAQTGIAAQLIDYDEFGNVTRDTTPGFQPFGFAGGLYDPDTSLVRFGARDYDASVGRWLAKDPIGFGGGQGNLYVYVGNDPINNIDPTGLEILPTDFIGPVREGDQRGLTCEQNQALRTLVAREAKLGSHKAARMSSITFGDGLLEPFNSSYGNTVPTPYGAMDLDWFTDVRSWSYGGKYTAPWLYAGGKLLWTAKRWANDFPIGHALPFRDAAENVAMLALLEDQWFAGLFNETFFKTYRPADACQ
jgi:RHS repeat-associated protein